MGVEGSGGRPLPALLFMRAPPPSPAALSGALIWELNHISKLTALHL